MALTFEQLVALLTPEAGSLRVRGADLQTPPAATLFSGFLSDGALAMNGVPPPVIDADHRRVSLKGALDAGTFLSVGDSTVTDATFELSDAGAVTVRIAVAPAPVAMAAPGGQGWTLPLAFPSVAGGILDDLLCASPLFTLDSTSPSVLPPGFRASFGYGPDLPAVVAALHTGLHFSAAASFKGELAADLATLIAAPVALSGPVEVLWQEDPNTKRPAALPQLLLTTTETGHTQRVGTYTFTFSLEVASLLQQVGGATPTKFGAMPVGVIAVRTNLSAPSLAQPVPISAYLYEGSDSRITLSAGEPPGAQLDPGQLPTLLDGQDPSGLLNPGGGFPVAHSLTLRDVSATIGLEPVSLESIAVAVELDADPGGWQVLGVLAVEDIGILLAAQRFAGTGVSVEAAVYADAHLVQAPNVKLEAYVSLPDLAFAVKLADDRTVDLTGTVHGMVGTGAIPMKAMTGETLALTGNVKAQSYQLDADIQEHWRLVGDDAHNLTLEDVHFTLASTAGKVSGSVYATLSLLDAGVFLSAGYQSGGGWTFTGGTTPGQRLNLTALIDDLAQVLAGFSLPPGLPEVELDALTVEYQTAVSQFDLGATVKLPDASFDLTSLPLVGPHLDAADRVYLGDIAFTMSHDATGTDSKLTLTVGFGATESVQVAIPLAKRPAADVPALDAGAPPTPGAEGGTALTHIEAVGSSITYPKQGSGIFIPVQRSFGPVRIEKLGFSVSSGGLTVQLVGGLSIAGLELDILGLEMDVPLHAPFAPSFDLHGLGVSYNASAVRVAGGLLKVDHPAVDHQPAYTSYDGALIVQAEALSLTAIASYATTDPPSLFAFVIVDVPLGGPAFFFVTGLAGGFGVNRELIMPGPSEVATYPLVAGASPQTNPFGKSPTLDDFIAGMEKYINVSIGEQWLAAGIGFTSFQLLNSFALLTVAFGKRVQIGLLGLSTLALPPEEPVPVVQAQLALEAVYAPNDGVLLVAGELTPQSYVFSADCHLTGGFAFCLWAPPSQFAGDFVATLGGYHPQFKPPAHYPTVPRLGFSWNVRNVPLAIKGGEYVALVPHMVMAGGQLDATWSSGPISAWFDAKADFLIGWQPFHYDVQIGVSFGVKASLDIGITTVSISVHVGASLHIWGPEFTGDAHIDLSVVSFTISFGAGSSKRPDPQTWPQFKASFMKTSTPPPDGSPRAEADPPATPVQAGIQQGLLADLRGTGAPVDYLVDPARLVVGTRSLVPATTLMCNGAVVPGTPAQDIAIGPMALDELTTNAHQVTVTRDGNPDHQLVGALATAPAPRALWANDSNSHKALNGPTQIAGTGHGVNLTPASSSPDHSLPIAVPDLLYDVVGEEPWGWGDDVAPTSDPYGGKNPWTELVSTIAETHVANERVKLVQELVLAGFGVSPVMDVTALTERDELGLLDPPLLRLLGERKAA